MRLPDALTRSSLRSWAIAALLFGGTILLFSRVTGFGFVTYDDPSYILNNIHVRTGFTWSNVAWAFFGRADYWHPLTWLSHMLDWRLYGDNAAGHHFTSVLWHAVNAALAFALLHRLTRAFTASAFAAAIFAWHPLRVESVAWITERKDVMSGCFFLLTLWAYASYADARAADRPSRGKYAVALALFALGLMCKPTLVALPLVLLVLDYWPLQRVAARVPASAAQPDAHGSAGAARVAWRGLLIEKLPFFGLAALAAVATLVMQRAVGAFTLDLPLGARLANVPVAIARYVGKFFWPFDLSVCYPHPGWWPAWTVIAALLLVIALTVAAWRLRNAQPWLLAGWGWFLAMLILVIGVVQVGFQSLADRYTYLPMLGWTVAVVWTIDRFAATQTVRLAVTGFWAVILAGLGARTWNQEATWRDSVALFSHAVAVTPPNDVAEGFLGFTLARTPDLAGAKQHTEKALALNPKNAMATYSRAVIALRENRLDDAIAAYAETIKLQPGDASTEFEYGLLLLRRGHLDDAAAHLHTALKLDSDTARANRVIAERLLRSGDLVQANTYFVASTILEPKNPQVWFAAGMTFVTLGSDGPARASFQRAIALQPDFAGAQTEFGLLLLRHRDAANAVGHFRAALAKDAKSVRARVGLGRADEELGNRAEATGCFEQAVAAAPKDAGVQRAWAEVLARRGEFAQAARFYRAAAQLEPNDAQNHAGLGYMLFLTGQKDAAIAEWREALRLNPNFPDLRERIQKATQP